LTKVVIVTDDENYKFSVLSSGKWAKDIRHQAEMFPK
jgi:hypothetical protein